jgi:RNA polymerase sigma factor (sigma-70 family)
LTRDGNTRAVTDRRLVQSRSVGVEWDRSSDEELLGAARRAPAAFGVFYERYEERMLRYFLARVGDAEVAADLTAETFAAALAGAHRFRPRKGPAAAWLFGIARNTLAMSRRRGRVEARARRALGAPVLVLTDEVIERIEALGGPALELVEALPPDERLAVRARVVDERDYSDIAKLTLANPNRDARGGGHRLGPTNSSSSATLFLCDTEMLRWVRLAPPNAEKLAMLTNMWRMSAERLEKKYRGYSYSATRPLGSFVLKRLTVRQPSEWMRPRRSSLG